MKNKKNIILSIMLIILISLSLLLFFGINSDKKTSIQLATFAFIIFDDVLLFGNIILFLNKKMNAFLIAGLSSTTFLYLISSLLINIIFKSIFTSLRGVLVFNFSLILIYILINTTILIFKRDE